MKITPKLLKQLDRTVGEFDKEFVVDTFSPLSPEDQAKWQRIKNKRGRPTKGKGVKVISVSVEKELLTRSDALARSLGVTRADLIDRGLHAVLAVAGKG